METSEQGRTEEARRAPEKVVGESKIGDALRRELII